MEIYKSRISILEEQLKNEVISPIQSSEYNKNQMNSPVPDVKEEESLSSNSNETTEIIPIEVKSGKDYKRHVALENLLNNTSYKINRAYTLCQGNIECDKKRIYLPIYLIMFFKNIKNIDSKIINIDISALT